MTNSLIFTIQYVFQFCGEGGNWRHRRAGYTVARVRQAALNTRAAEFVSSVHYKSQKLLLLQLAGCREVMPHHDVNQSQLFKCEVIVTRRVVNMTQQNSVCTSSLKYIRRLQTHDIGILVAVSSTTEWWYFRLIHGI